MDSEKINHLKEDGMLREDKKRRSEYFFPDKSGKIFSYHPFNSIQIIFYDIHSPEIPDLWKLGFRKGDSGKYLRTLICRHGSCEFTVNGKTSTLSSGHVMMDYGIGDDKCFSFTSDDFSGIEITMQVDSLVNESSMFKMLRIVVESMNLPEEDIYDSDGYLFSYSKSTEQTVDKLLSDGFNSIEGVIIIAHIIEIGHNLGTDLKEKAKNDSRNISKKQLTVAEDIYRCLKKYFKNVYGYGFKEYQTKVRMEWAADKLTTTNMKVGIISDSVGYAKHTKFCKAFKKYYGVTPLVFRRTNKIDIKS